MKNVVILNYSDRKQGNCTRVASYIAMHHSQTNVHTYVIDSRISPCGGCDYECLKPKEKCPRVTTYQEEVMNAVIASDLTYMIVPNYCGFPCANFLAFNERSVGFFNMDRTLMNHYMNVKKKFVIVSNSENEVFDQAMRQQTNDAPEVLYLKSGKYGKRSIAGDILNCDVAKADLDAFLAEGTAK